MRKSVFILMAAAAVLAGCKNGNKKAAEVPEPVDTDLAAIMAEAEEELNAASADIEKDLQTLADEVEQEAVPQREALDIQGAVEGIEGAVETAKETLEKAAETPVPFAAVEVKPTFNGGDANDFVKWVNSHIEYPAAARDAGEEGKVILQFSVSKDGAVENVRVAKSSGNELLDGEALRVVQSSPKWEAGEQNGNPVAVAYTFPVIFKIQ